MTGMPPLGLAIHIMAGMIMTVVIVVLLRLLNTNGSRIMILTTWMILHPQMALIGHHARVKMRLPTWTHPLEQRIGIDAGIDPRVVVGPSPITTGLTMDVVHMTVAVIAP